MEALHPRLLPTPRRRMIAFLPWAPHTLEEVFPHSTDITPFSNYGFPFAPHSGKNYAKILLSLNYSYV